MIALRVHLFPSRTQKLSSITPTIVKQRQEVAKDFFYYKNVCFLQINVFFCICTFSGARNFLALLIELIYPLVLAIHGLNELKKLNKQAKKKRKNTMSTIQLTHMLIQLSRQSNRFVTCRSPVRFRLLAPSKKP